MRKMIWLLLASLMLLAGCEISLREPATVSVKLSIDDRSRTRTVTPNTFYAADSYTAELRNDTDTYTS